MNKSQFDQMVDEIYERTSKPLDRSVIRDILSANGVVPVAPTAAFLKQCDIFGATDSGATIQQLCDEFGFSDPSTIQHCWVAREQSRVYVVLQVEEDGQSTVGTQIYRNKPSATGHTGWFGDFQIAGHF